jgi:hypothetical protein
MNRVMPATIALAILMCGCAADTVRARAAHDFDCPEEEIEVQEVTDGTFSARGCGERGTYVCGRSGGPVGAPGSGTVCFRDD